MSMTRFFILTAHRTPEHASFWDAAHGAQPPSGFTDADFWALMNGMEWPIAEPDAKNVLAWAARLPGFELHPITTRPENEAERKARLVKQTQRAREIENFMRAAVL